MTNDLRCPRCGSKMIKNYSMSMAKYGSPDAKYVCEDCGYVGGLILDVSKDIDEKNKREVEKDLAKIKKEMSEEYR